MRVYHAVKEDIDDLIRMRMGYIKEDLELSCEMEERLFGQIKTYFTEHLGKDCIGLLAEEGGKVIASAVLVLAEKPASPDFMTGKTGTIMSVFTEPGYRGRGIATGLVGQLIEEARKTGLCSVDLLATGMGKKIYEHLGFHEISYTPMRLRLQGE